VPPQRTGGTAGGTGRSGRLPAAPRRDVVDHALARRALLTSLSAGGLLLRTSPDAVCDASAELVRAAQELGVAVERACPVCARGLLREVAWVFGEALGAMSGTARTPLQLAALAARRPEFTVHEVEVCTGCRWNHLLRSWRTGAPGPPA
jgi:hypothetical protein